MHCTQTKEEVISTFKRYVSPYKAEFYEKYGISFVQGPREGCYLGDVNGKTRLFNLHCNGGVFNFGHSNEENINVVVEAMRDSNLDIGNHHLISGPRAMLGELLAEVMPGDITQCVFGVSGGEAIDFALKLSRGYTGRPKIISVMGGYHGHTGLAMKAGDARFRSPFAPCDEHGTPLFSKDFIQVPFADLEALEDVIDETTAAIILETVPATLGMVIPPPGYLQGIRALCDEWGVQMIIDEVQTGVGRTGRFLAIEHFPGVVPDIVVMGKGLSGGIYPMSVTCFRPHLAAVLRVDPFAHISTFGGSEIGCILTHHVIKRSHNPEFLSHVTHMATCWKRAIQPLLEKYTGFVTEFRQLGLFMALAFVDPLAGKAMTKAGFENGILVVYAGNDTRVVQILPPLIMEECQLSDVIKQLDATIARAKVLVPIIKGIDAASAVIGMITGIDEDDAKREREEAGTNRGVLPLEAMKRRAEKQGYIDYKPPKQRRTNDLTTFGKTSGIVKTLTITGIRLVVLGLAVKGALTIWDSISNSLTNTK